MKYNSLFKQKSLVLATTLCLLPAGNVGAEETGFINTLPIYSEQTSPISTLTLPLFRFQGDEETLHTGTLELNWKTAQWKILEYYEVPRATEVEMDEGFPEDKVFQRILINN